MRLVYEKSGIEVKVGDSVTLRNGEKVTVTDIQKPHKPASTGRVYVSYDGKNSTSYFPGVIDAKWIEREDQA